MDRKTFIYLLRDPLTQDVRYVGKTVKTLRKRLCGHISQARGGKSDTYRDRWIRGLGEKGFIPLIEQIEVCGDNWAARERHWIAEFRSAGARLTNHTDGGEGTLGIRFSPERRKACSERVSRQLADPKVLAERTKRLIENASDPVFRQRRSVQHTEWMMQPDRRTAYSECMRKQMQDPERRRRASDHAKALMNDPVRRAIRDAKVAVFWTPERRAAQADRARQQAIQRRERQAAEAMNRD
ncbi:GIY-YIG nuclease family protein [Caballeronia sp. dw_19]|uniref:GIY-YIG nuclease family protein n=1 Tax=Caballeronia sp. dw_19 TaxID=2719791 RepID=UPI001BD0B54D|nr:GIY-YIG nuclease family protein [Caballeronia sp. dw_19]